MERLFTTPFGDVQQQEEGLAFAPSFDEKGLITTIVSAADSGEVLMLAHMNAEALRLTLETGIAHYWSRSRNSLWKKGETSGNMQHVVEIRTDCDQDAIWLKVRVDGHGASCHTGRNSCFYRAVRLQEGKTRLEFVDDAQIFDPQHIYSDISKKNTL